MSVNLIQKKLIQLEIQNLSQKEIQSHLKESIKKVTYFYDVLDEKDLSSDSKLFLKAYWKTKLNALLDMYQQKYGGNLLFLSKQEVETINRFREE